MNATITDYRKNKTTASLKLKRLLNEYQTEFNMTHKKYYCTKNYQKEIAQKLLTIKTIISRIDS